MRDNLAIPIDTNDVINGTLNAPSNIRQNRLFTADENIVLYSLGNLKDDKLNEVIDSVVTMFKSK